MKSLRVILIAIFLILPAQVLAQSGDVPIETPPSETSTPTETPKPIETPAPTEKPVSSTPLTTPESGSVTSATSRPVSSPTPTQLPSLSPSPSSQPEPSPAIEDSNTTAQASNNLVLGIVLAVIAIISGAFGYVVYKGKTQKKNDKDDRCGSIRDLLEQKKKELEDFIRNWPEEKIKALAKEKVMDGLKKNEDIEKIIETAESLKAKHDKLKETIELLQKRYDICMLELPSLDKGKTLKFKGFKTKLIIDGSKTATMRLFDDKDLQVGDKIDLVNSDDGKFFAKAEITEVVEKKLDQVDVIDLDGHEKWNNKEEMLESFKKYYGNKVNLDTLAKIIKFKIIK